MFLVRLFIVIFRFVLLIDRTFSDMSKEGVLLNELLINQSKYIRPSIDPATPTVVLLEFGLRKVESLNEKIQVLTTSGFIVANWINPYLTWDPADHSNISRLIIPGNLVWLPEIALYNSAESIRDISLYEADNFRVAINNDGLVTWIPGGQWVTECEVNLQLFPYDTQTCSIVFINWMNKEALQYRMMRPGTVRTEVYSPNREWELLNSTSTTATMLLDMGENMTMELSTASFTLLMRRNPGYYLLNLIVPTLTLSLISVLMFWLPPECGERVSFGITILLSYSVTMMMMADVTPKSGSDMPVVMYYVVACMLLNAVSLCLSVFIIHVSKRGVSKPASARVKSLVFGFLAPLVRSRDSIPNFRLTSHDVDKDNKISDKDDSEVRRIMRKIEAKFDENEKSDHVKEEWLAICRVIDYSLFIVVFCFLSSFTVGFAMYIMVLRYQ